MAPHGTLGRGLSLRFSLDAQLCVYGGLIGQPPTFVGFQASVTHLLVTPKAVSLATGEKSESKDRRIY